MPKYAIVYLLCGEAEHYHRRLTKQIYDKFGGKYLLSDKIPAHITLKAPFEIDNIRQVENALLDFCKGMNPAQMKIEGFGDFSGEIIFLDAHAGEDMLSLYSDLLYELSKIPSLPWSEFDIREKRMHATIAYAESPENFTQIMHFLSRKRPRFEILVDNIALIEKHGSKWEIMRRFELGG